ncbi:MAG: hypothetical protein HC861_06995 [Rhodospirillaceae bacterium]|nr:hypothetical protein [Rhodospirillaceae bacterium]
MFGKLLRSRCKLLIEPQDGRKGVDMVRMQQRFALIATVKKASNMLQRQKDAAHVSAPKTLMAATERGHEFPRALMCA